MGLYPIDCQKCKAPFLWFSGGNNPFQVCDKCMDEVNNVNPAVDDMKVIFLDFDGVLNSQGSFLLESNLRKAWNKKSKDDGEKSPHEGPVNATLCHVCTSNFQYVLEQYPGVKVVLSTTWRELFEMDWLKEKLASYGIDSSRVIDKTPKDHTYNQSRGDEIQWWLDRHPEVTHYVIIDDNDWDIKAKHGEDRFVQTTWESGMTFAHAVELHRKLSNANKKKIQDAKARQEGT